MVRFISPIVLCWGPPKICWCWNRGIWF